MELWESPVCATNSIMVTSEQCRAARGLLGWSQQELAKKLAVTKGNMVGLVNRLSRRGFVKRVPSRRGRRANVIHLTAAGRKLVTAALPDHLRLVKAMMSPLASGEQQELCRLLHRLDERE